MSETRPPDPIEPPDDATREVPMESAPTMAFHPEVLEPHHEHEKEAHVAGAFRYALVVERGPQAGLTYILGEGETSIGRGEDAGIFLGDVTVSRHHAKLTLRGDELTIEDLGSTNGTYVNGERVERAVLRAGDEIFVGKFRLVVVEGDV